jgi:hypothetical protein
LSTLANHSAPGQALGYYFQLERALSWIAKAPAGSYIGIETEDDVVIKLLDGEMIYEQDKSSTSTYPFNTGKKDLWKTLLIWLEAVKNKEIDINNSYFYLVTNRVKDNSLAERMGLAQDEIEVATCIKELREKSAEISEEVKVIADKVIAFADHDLAELIKKISYRSGDETYGDGLRKILEGDLQLDMDASEQNESIITELLGWLYTQVTNAWRSKDPAFIGRDKFHRQKLNIITNYRQSVVNKTIIELGQIPEEEERMQWTNKYVKQLELIGCTSDDINKAIYEYLNAVSKRTDLAKRGYLTIRHLADLDENLEQHWRNIFRSRKISHQSLRGEDIGQIIYFDTIDYDTAVGDYVLKSHFLTRGSYHSLADQLKVGWHPEYQYYMKSKPEIVEFKEKEEEAKVEEAKKDA